MHHFNSTEPYYYSVEPFEILPNLILILRNLLTCTYMQFLTIHAPFTCKFQIYMQLSKIHAPFTCKFQIHMQLSKNTCNIYMQFVAWKFRRRKIEFDGVPIAEVLKSDRGESIRIDVNLSFNGINSQLANKLRLYFAKTN